MPIYRSCQKNGFFFIAVLCLLGFHGQSQTPDVTQAKALPESVSNNAVTEGLVNGVPYVYSFGGIDSSKEHEGIHLKSWRYNTVADTWQSIPTLPDTMGKIAAAASRIGDTIFIIGGYHVFAGGSEASSSRVHRYDIQSGSYLADGANVPVPIDDQVQCVWRDSLIYVMTGWSNNGNVTNVQIYNPSAESWQQGTPVPDKSNYKVFGASGAIVDDTIYYFGGATMGFNFPISNVLRKGVIRPQQPDSITWTDTVLQNNLTAYRTAATTVEDTIFWLGGSRTTYNFDGIAYDGSGGGEPADQLFAYMPSTGNWWVDTLNLPMDLRGVAATSERERYLVGGMVASQQVTDSVVKLKWPTLTSNEAQRFFEKQSEEGGKVYPNPASETINILLESSAKQLTLYNLMGQKVKERNIANDKQLSLNVGDLEDGVYLIRLDGSGQAKHEKVIISE